MKFGDASHAKLERKIIMSQNYTIGHYNRTLDNWIPGILSPGRFFENFRDLSLKDWFLDEKTNFYPYNVYVGEGKEYVVEVALAGIGKDQIQVHIQDKTLFIDVNPTVDEKEYIKKGISKRKAQLSFLINPDLVDANQVRSTYKDGLLTVTVPVRKQEIKPVDIEVTVN